MLSLEKQAFEAYTYLFPLVFCIQQIKRYAKDGVEGKGGVGYNAFSHAKKLADIDSKFVSVNNDTIYSFAAIDLSGGPLTLELPDSEGRYYVGQMVDAWTNNFAYVGSRGTQGKETKVCLIPPNFKGDVPDALPTIQFPTPIGIIIMRYAINGTEDMVNVRRLQEKTKLMPVEPQKNRDFTAKENNVIEGLDFFNEGVSYMRRNPASEKDRVTIERKFIDLKLDDYEEASEEIRQALSKANDQGLEYLRTLLSNQKLKHEYSNGWDMNLHAFDYNDTYFEMGAINSPKYIIQDREEAITTRALAALSGLWGNHAYEAAYFALWEDENGVSLKGDKNYSLTFETLPPAKAFWSLTMYDMPEFFLVENEINRYSIGDRTEGIIYNEDGSLTLYMSNKKPRDEKKLANWLPAPRGQFRPMLRMYLPEDAVFKSDFKLPVAKVIP